MNVSGHHSFHIFLCGVYTCHSITLCGFRSDKIYSCAYFVLTFRISDLFEMSSGLQQKVFAGYRRYYRDLGHVFCPVPFFCRNFSTKPLLKCEIQAVACLLHESRKLGN